MRLNERDKAILSNLKRFRCMSRDDIAAIHFNTVKNPIKSANHALLRLYRQGLIDRSANYEPFVYFPADILMKKNSQKIPHFIEIVGVYRDLLSIEPPTTFTVEPKYSKGLAEPDIFTVFKNSPLFIEVQCSTYSEKIMSEKIARYDALYESKLLHQEVWQLHDQKPVFPAVLILTSNRYAVKSLHFPILQSASISDFMRQMTQKQVLSKMDKPRQTPVITIKNNRGA